MSAVGVLHLQRCEHAPFAAVGVLHLQRYEHAPFAAVGILHLQRCGLAPFAAVGVLHMQRCGQAQGLVWQLQQKQTYTPGHPLLPGGTERTAGSCCYYSGGLFGLTEGGPPRCWAPRRVVCVGGVLDRVSRGLAVCPS
jgi:hypothetical protein